MHPPSVGPGMGFDSLVCSHSLTHSLTGLYKGSSSQLTLGVINSCAKVFMPPDFRMPLTAKHLEFEYGGF